MRKFRTLVLLLVSVALVFVIAACGDKKDSAKDVTTPEKTGLDAKTIQNDKFKDLYPLQYQSMMDTQKEYKTEFAGGERVFKYLADKEPLLPILFNGNPFQKDYQEDRGHFYANEDVSVTLRVTDKSPGACLTCKSTAVPLLVEEMGDNYWKGSFRNEIFPKAESMGHSSIGCSDCHDPTNMELRVTRVNFVKGMESKGVDISKATKKEMRSYVCGQCHSEYYFAPSNSEVTFPWKNGFTAEEMYTLYEGDIKASGFAQDFKHNISASPIIKAQHPDFENFQGGIHAKNGVACADCHMPYETKDGKKYSSHHLQSPLMTMEKSCGTCHDDWEDRKERVHEIQSDFKEHLDEAEDVSATAHYYVSKMITSGVDPAKITEAQAQIRKGQFLWDYCAAENGTGFHNWSGEKKTLDGSIEASEAAIAIAKEQLTAKGVDLTELDAKIKEKKDAVAAEMEQTAKHTKAWDKNPDGTNGGYFPQQFPPS